MNTQSLLREESHLGRVDDPAGGSAYVESLTDAVAREAWALMCRIERCGGMYDVLSSGDIADWVMDAAESDRDTSRSAPTHP